MNYRTKYLRKVLGCFGTSGASLWASLTFAFSSLVWTSAVTTMVALTTLTNAPTTVEAKDVYHIGAVLSGVDNTIHFTQAIEDISSEANILPPNVAFYAITVRMSGNPIKTAQSVCETLIKHQVYAVIISHPSNGELSPASVSYTCGFYNIPVIGISSRDSSLSDKVEPIIEYEPGITDITSDLKKANESHCRVFILYANTEDAEGIFREVEEMNMADPGYVWIASEQCLNAVNRPDGILGLVLINASDERAHIQDSVRVVGLAFQQLFIRENITAAPTDCTNTGRAWDTGLKFVNYMKKQTLLYGKTGHVAFDDKGDRLDSDYDVVNIVLGQPVTVGHYTFSKLSMKLELSLNVKDIIWPGNVTAAKPTGHIIPKHLRVVTIAEKPFVWIRPVNDELECLEDEIYCPKTNTSDGGSYSYCCRGYCMDLLRALSYELNFTYTLYQVEDGQYGSHEFVNGSKEKIWTGMVGELVNKRADMIVAPLTINPERSTAIEFSKPFKYQGITILEKTQPRHSTLASFLQPFHKTLWILVMVSVHVVALALYLLDRFSPFGRYKLPNSDATEEDALNLSSAIWFAWGVLLNSGIGEGTPRSFSARVLGMVWAGFAMIVVASYTANLAAFLVLDRPEMSLTGINDARLRNPMENFTYATVKGSAVDMYFRRQVELSNMYRTMEGKNYENTEEAIEAVKEDRLNAFIWDSSRLEYEAAQDCDLKTAGEPFGRSGYGIGLQRNSFWADDVTLALLKMHEKGDMEDLDNKWILQGGNKCNSKHEKFPATLGLKNMAGVFILVGAGIVGGVGLIIIEIIYKKHQTRKQRRLELARHAADKWRGAVEPNNEPNNDPLHTPSPCYTGFAASLPLYLSAYPDLDINNEPPVETVMPNISYYEMNKDDSEGSKIKNNKKASTVKPPPYVDVALWLRQSQLDDDEKRKTLRATLQAQKRLKANGMEAFTIEKGMLGLTSGSTFPTSSTTLSFDPHQMEPPPPPPPPRWVPPLDRTCPPLDMGSALGITDIDGDFGQGIPPPPPPPASSPAVRMRGGRVRYVSRGQQDPAYLHPGGNPYDIPV